MPRPLPHCAAPAATVRNIGLTPGQILHIWLPAGATLVCNGPSLTVISAPQWLAGQWLQPRQVLGEGQSMRLEHGGWVHIDAARGGELLCLHPLANHRLARLVRAMRRLTDRLRAAYRGRSLSGVRKTG